MDSMEQLAWIQETLERALACARREGVRDADVFVSSGESLAVHVREGHVERVEHASSCGLNVRVLSQGRCGAAWTERLEDESLLEAFRAARANAALQDPAELELPAPQVLEDSAEALGLYNPALDALDAETLGRFGLEAEAAARGADARVKAVPYLGVARARSAWGLGSTRGVVYAQRENSVSSWCGALLEAQDRLKSGYAHRSRRHWDEAEAQHLGREAVERAAALMSAQSIPSTRAAVVLDEYCAPQIFGLYAGCFSGEAAQRGLSRLRGRQGERIADPQVTIFDEPHRAGESASRLLDGEGTPTRTKPLIEAGILQGLFHHVESARREGAQSSGHAARSAQGEISAQPHTLRMHPGQHEVQALCAMPERCLLVKELEGRSGCNPVSGDLSIGVQGMWIEQGRETQPVDAITIAGNFFDLLHSIRACGAHYAPELSRWRIPSLLIETMAISG